MIVSAPRLKKKRIGRTRFGWSRSRGVSRPTPSRSGGWPPLHQGTPHPRLLPKTGRVRAGLALLQPRRLPPQKRSPALRFADFGRRHEHRFLFLNINTSKARKFAAGCSIKPGRFCFREIGGTKNRGPAPSTTCSWKMALWFALLKQRGLGKWMGFMTDQSFNDLAR